MQSILVVPGAGAGAGGGRGPKQSDNQWNKTVGTGMFITAGDAPGISGCKWKFGAIPIFQD